MLNINNRISLSRTSKRRIKKYWKSVAGNLNSGSWGSLHNSVKNELSKKLLVNQSFRCVYCERYLYGLSPEMDHFAHKAMHSRFAFNPTNIFYACHFCNSPDRKGQLDTVLIFNNRYDQCVFQILHPYFDDVDTEIVFQDTDCVLFHWENCSQMAKNTIVHLQFDDLIMTTIRSRTLIYERLNPLTSTQEKELIEASITYK